MGPTEYEIFHGPGAKPPPERIEALSWAEAVYYKRLHGNNVRLPRHMAHLTLEQLEARAAEETRPQREAQEAAQSAMRIAAAPKSIERALLDGPSSKQARPQRGWRQRVRYLNLLRRCRSHREAAARLGVDESTVRRWRRKYPGFRARCDEIVAERYRQNADDLKLRAGAPQTRAVFFRGKQVGEQAIPDDRALMFLLKLEDAQQARAEAREERREQRAHEIRLRELEISKMHASAAHPAAPVEADSSGETKDLATAPADIAPPEAVEASNASPDGGRDEEANSSPVSGKVLPIGGGRDRTPDDGGGDRS